MTLNKNKVNVEEAEEENENESTPHFQDDEESPENEKPVIGKEEIEQEVIENKQSEETS